METYDELVKRIGPVLKRIAYKLDNRNAFFNRDDLYQEALVRLWQEYAVGRLADKTDSYILQGCYFHLKNYIRMHHKPRFSFESLEGIAADEQNALRLEEKLSSQDSASRDIYEQLNSRLLAQTIQNNGLSVREKFILSLCGEGLTTREIGARLGVSHVRVVKLLGGIREKCRKYLD